VLFNPVGRWVREAGAFSDPSQIAGLPWKRRAVPDLRVTDVRLQRGIHFQLDIYGANPLGPPGTPGIDVRVRFEAARATGRLNINANLTGDAFPNTEVILEDRAGRRRMLQSFVTSRGSFMGPMTLLWGNKQRPMNGLCASIAVDEQGRFV
jgi:hypothetical protein